MNKTANPDHEVAYQDMVGLLSKHADKIDALEMLAIGANMIGKLLAMQDQRTITPRQAMDVVIRNLELGNQQAIQNVERTKGSA